jgi:hypothetical protein
MHFYTIGSSELVCETISNLNNPIKDKHVHNNIMTKFLEDTNQGTPSQGDSHDFPLFGNVGVLLMGTLNIPRLNFRLLIWLWTTPNVLNYLDASQIITLCHGHQMNVDPLSFACAKSTYTPSPSSGESIVTSNQKSKRNRKRKIKKKNSPTSTSHVGYMPLAFASHARSSSLVCTIHTGNSSPTSVSHVGYLKPSSSIHVGGKSPV